MNARWMQDDECKMMQNDDECKKMNARWMVDDARRWMQDEDDDCMQGIEYSKDTHYQNPWCSTNMSSNQTKHQLHKPAKNRTHNHRPI